MCTVNYKDLNPQILDEIGSYDEHECVRRFVLDNGIVAIVAVHNTNLGPSLGGLRMKRYDNEAEAINDVLRLSRGMTYKNAMAGLPLGGGKAVIIGDHRTQKTDELMQQMGASVETLEGSYITAEDSGSTEEDMINIATQTPYVCGLPPEIDENGYGELGGNPSPMTALGCYEGIKSAVAFKYEGARQLKDMTVAIQGVGAVGLELAKLLHQDGAKIIISDISQENIVKAEEALNGKVGVVTPDRIYSTDAEIFAPCAMGGILNDETIEQMSFDIIAGAANNQLLAEHHDQMLMSKDILYVPDYVVNAGGVICVGYEFFRRSGYNPQEFNINRENMVAHVERIGKTVTDILTRAKQSSKPTGETADILAEERFLKGVALNDTNPEGSTSFDVSGGTRMVQ